VSPEQTTTVKLSREDREMIVAWFQRYEQSLPEPVRRLLAEPLARLRSEGCSDKVFKVYGRQLARALGLIPSSERRRPSGRPLGNAKTGRGSRDRSGPATATPNQDQGGAEVQTFLGQARCENVLEDFEQTTSEEKHVTKEGALDEGKGSTQAAGETDACSAPRELSPEKRAEIAAEAAAFIKRAQFGDGEDPAFIPAGESLMNADVVCVDEDNVLVPAVLPEGVEEKDVVKTLIDERARYDFAVTVTRIDLDVEKKVVVTRDGKRRVISGSVHEYGPKGFAVTWQALATLAVMIGQFAMPLHRLGTMLSTATKKFSATSLGRMAHYVAERFAPIYLVLMEQLADADILAGDDTSCRVLEVSSYFEKARQTEDAEPRPWRGFATIAAANETYLEHTRRKSEILALRAEGDREAMKTQSSDPPLKVVIGRELDFESQRKSGDGPKQSLNTTVLTGRTDADDPSSQVVFYRSHLGSLGNLLEMLLSRRTPSKRKLIVQSDLSTTNLVTDPKLTSRFDIDLVGCSAHARRPFAQYEDQDPKPMATILAGFRVLAVHEDTLDRIGRNKENTLAVRDVDSRKMWEKLKEACARLAERWTKATPLGNAARYIIEHYEKLTAYLTNPRLDATNNHRERLLRTEKLIEKSSMFRKSIEGRVVLDIIRTILQTAVAAGASPHEYLVDVLKSSPADIAAHPERYTPAAWAKRWIALEEAIAAAQEEEQVA